ncbi:MAG: hypothetical protein ACRDRT_14015, partial [Pseudonocardiaceae bacterium]
HPYRLSSAPTDAPLSANSLLGLHIGTEESGARQAEFGEKRGRSGAPHNYIGLQIELPMLSEEAADSEGSANLLGP